MYNERSGGLTFKRSGHENGRCTNAVRCDHAVSCAFVRGKFRMEILERERERERARKRERGRERERLHDTKTVLQSSLVAVVVYSGR